MDQKQGKSQGISDQAKKATSDTASDFSKMQKDVSKGKSFLDNKEAIAKAHKQIDKIQSTDGDTDGKALEKANKQLDILIAKNNSSFTSNINDFLREEFGADVVPDTADVVIAAPSNGTEQVINPDADPLDNIASETKAGDDLPPPPKMDTSEMEELLNSSGMEQGGGNDPLLDGDDMIGGMDGGISDGMTMQGPGADDDDGGD